MKEKGKRATSTIYTKTLYPCLKISVYWQVKFFNGFQQLKRKHWYGHSWYGAVVDGSCKSVLTLD